ADPQVDGEPGRGAPVVLQIRAHLIVVGVDDGIAVLPYDLERHTVVVCFRSGASRRAARVAWRRVLGEEELWCLPVRLVDVVGQERGAHATLHDVVATAVEPRIRDVIAHGEALLSESLRAQV